MTSDPVTDDLTIPSDLAEAHALQDRIEASLQSIGYGENDRFKIRLAVEEALVNAIKHGNQLDSDKRVQVSYQITADRFDIRITDEGLGFNPEDVPDPTEEGTIERPSGRGLFIIRGFMTEVQYHGRGNVVTMSKVRNGTPTDSE